MASTQLADELWAMPAFELAERIRRRAVSPVELADDLLARIERLNPRLNAFVTLSPERTRAAAQAAERAVMAGAELGLLHGVPVSIKDTYWVRGARHTSGSKLLAQFVPSEDSPPVERLEAAGAVNLGKTNTAEFGWRGSTDNPLFGETRNPWDLTRTPGGSSGGAAAAVAAGLGPLALGGDGAGSIRIPASFCGLVGLKPTFGRVPAYPPAATNELLVHAGPITRTVRDAALMLQAMAGPHRRDPLSLSNDGADFLRDLEAGVRDLRIAWSADLGFLAPEPEVGAIAESCVQVFETMGAHVEQADLKIVDPSAILQVLFGGTSVGLHSRRPPEEKAQMDPGLVAYAEAGANLTLVDYVKAVAARQAIVAELTRFFERYDLLVTPAVAVPAFPLGQVDPNGVNGRPVAHLGWSLGYIFNWSGQPALSIPAGWTRDGLPVGLQIVGRRLEDALVLRAGRAFERERPWSDRWPDFAATAV
jgi:aspartyl-tRNA(Asn)/glutamyl-tRNA(Gln) amidotransferase subunit A